MDDLIIFQDNRHDDKSVKISRAAKHLTPISEVYA